MGEREGDTRATGMFLVASSIVRNTKTVMPARVSTEKLRGGISRETWFWGTLVAAGQRPDDTRATGNAPWPWCHPEWLSEEESCLLLLACWLRNILWQE
jgi:hypothetical protein